MIHFERMTAAHVEQVAELEKICFSQPWSENSITSELCNPLSLWIVAVEDDVVAGYIGSQSVEGQADMMNVAVHPDYRRRGIGAQLVEHLIDALHESGVYALSLEVRASNAPAIAMYEKIGFQQVGLRPNYYRNPKEDAKIMKKEWAL